MTLLELLAVVTIIGIFVALATPAMSGVMQDRHTGRAADEIANLFRIARSRAAATGAAHYVRGNASGLNASFELRSAVIAVGGPVSGCSQSSWGDGDSMLLKKLDFGASAQGSFGGKDILIRPAPPVGSALATGVISEYCFTPGGMPWWRRSGVWTRPLGADVARFDVSRSAGSGTVGLVRTVRVSPSGLPSIEAR